MEEPRDVRFIDALLTQLERKLGLEMGGIGPEVLIEEAEALIRVEQIAGSSRRLEVLIVGVGDLSASLGMRLGHVSATRGMSYPGDVGHFARSRMIAAARARHLDSVDGPSGDFKDRDAYQREAESACTLGAVGKWCIHPTQIELANRAFSPTESEVARARRIWRRFAKEAEPLRGSMEP